MTDFDTIWHIQDEIRTVVDAAVGCGIWDLSYSEQRSAIVLELTAYLDEETGQKVSEVHQIGAYSKVDRDPRGRTVTVAYLAIVDAPMAVSGQDDAAKAQWFPLTALPELAFDHEEIMKDAINVYGNIMN